MKKLLIGFTLGFILAIPITVYASALVVLMGYQTSSGPKAVSMSNPLPVIAVSH